jgi:centromeric protein E
LENRKSYPFDHVLDPKTNNYELFNTVARPIIHSSVSGFNGTVSAYGQTSSGKTYTMMGNQHEPGIIPYTHTIQYIFEAVNKVQGREFLLRLDNMQPHDGTDSITTYFS